MILIISGDFIHMKGTLQIITPFTKLKLIKYIGRSEMLKIFWFWHTYSMCSVCQVHHYDLKYYMK